MTNTLPKPVSFPVPDPHYAFVRSRKRSSGLTSVRWYDDETLFAGDFAAKAVYRVRPFSDKPIDAAIPSPDGSGKPTETDLMDLQGDTLLLSNFYTGEIAFYDVGLDKLSFNRVMLPAVPPRREVGIKALLRRLKGGAKASSGRKVHGVRFVPNLPNVLWVSYCDAAQMGVEIVTVDGRTVHSIPTSEQAQDTAFVEQGGVTYAIQAGRTDHISVDGPNESKMYATIFVYRVPKNLLTEAPELVATQTFTGHLDATKEYNGAVYGANQHDDCVDEFVFDAKRGTIELRRRFTGFDMPHGLDVRSDGLMAVTNYGPENDLRFLQLPEA